jgi:hypothetical protein
MDEDALELVRRIEEEFSIYLPTEDLLEVYTIGNLYKLLVRLLKPTPDFLVGSAFFRLRTALAAVLEIPPRSIRPSTFLDDLIDQKRIREQWSAVASACGLVLPGLQHTTTWKLWMKWAATVPAFLPTAAFHFAVARTLHGDFIHIAGLTILWFIGLSLWLILYAQLLNITSFRCSVLPVLTVGELARAVLPLNREQFRQECDKTEEPTESQIWMRLAAVLHEAGFTPGEIVPSASILSYGVPS